MVSTYTESTTIQPVHRAKSFELRVDVFHRIQLNVPDRKIRQNPLEPQCGGHNLDIACILICTESTVRACNLRLGELHEAQAESYKFLSSCTCARLQVVSILSRFQDTAVATGLAGLRAFRGGRSPLAWPKRAQPPQVEELQLLEAVAVADVGTHVGILPGCVQGCCFGFCAAAGSLDVRALGPVRSLRQDARLTLPRCVCTCSLCLALAAASAAGSSSQCGSMS